MISDAELNARLEQVYGFTPWDQFEWIRYNIRLGRLHIIIRHTPERSHYKDRVILRAPEMQKPPGDQSSGGVSSATG